MAKYIFVTGGVMSGLGKGIISSSIGACLEWMGYEVLYQKLDPYLNCDPGTMNPTEHGEVFVTHDGMETDMDFGHFERFTTHKPDKRSSVTSGQIYQNILEDERKGNYLGKTVQMVPHATNEIKRRLQANRGDFKIIELGGTIGDDESSVFLEAIRQFRKKNECILVHLTFVPYLSCSGEFKTKPTQHSVKLLRQSIEPDIIVARCEQPVGKSIINKIEAFCDAPTFMAEDVDNVYQIPVNLWNRGLINKVLELFKLEDKQPSGIEKLGRWQCILDKKSQQKIKLAIAGKYSNAKESYKSIVEAVWIASKHLELDTEIEYLDEGQEFHHYDAMIVPGGFGTRGIEFKILALQYARENNIPVLGICYGLQLQTIEYARNVLGIADAVSDEFFDDNPIPLEERGTRIITYMPGQEFCDKGGTMRLGKYRALVHNNTPFREMYGENYIRERHRHRLEFMTNTYEQFFKDSKIKIGMSAGELIEAIYLEEHPFYIGVQFHPEFKSKFLKPHPLFIGLLNKAKEEKEKT